MTWVTVIWSMLSASSLTLGMVHLFVWVRDREAVANLLFAIAAVAAAVIALQELALMRTQTPAEYQVILRWMYLPVTLIIISIVWFVRSYLGAGRLWLAWAITGLRVLILILSFSLVSNVTFHDVHALRAVNFLGETLSAPVGETNPWRILIHLSNVLFLIYVLDAAYAARKQGKSRQALALGGAVLLAIILAIIFSSLMVRGTLPGPLIALVFQVIVIAMAFELIVDLVRARRLAKFLAESEERIRLATRAATLSLWDWDIKQDAVWTDSLGRAGAEISMPRHQNMQSYLELLHPDDREPTREAINRALVDGHEFQTEFRILGPDGDTRWLSARGQVEYDKGGKPLRMRGVTYDITSRKNAEAELQERRYDLAHVSRVLTLGQLSSAIAHDINQPLGAILRNTEAAELFLRQTPPDREELHSILDDIRSDGQRAAAVIESMRSFLRRRELHFESIDIAELLEQVAQLVNTELQFRSTNLRIDIPRLLPRVHGDRIHLQQVVLNLLFNSLDALDESARGERNIIIRALQDQEDVIEVSVMDNGKGIEQQQLHSVFEPLFTTKEQGTGIGLAISKTIVESHGGVITARNNPEGGAVLSFTLKVVQEGVQT